MYHPCRPEYDTRSSHTGVPLVAIPVTNDQPGVSARIAYTRTGASVSLQELTVSRLTLLIDEVLRNPEYRDNANRLRQVIADTNGLERAVDLLEEALGLVHQVSDLAH
jgi:zeaxanthin glucosyltransferase